MAPWNLIFKVGKNEIKTDLNLTAAKHLFPATSALICIHSMHRNTQVGTTASAQNGLWVVGGVYVSPGIRNTLRGSAWVMLNTVTPFPAEDPGGLPAVPQSSRTPSYRQRTRVPAHGAEVNPPACTLERDGSDQDESRCLCNHWSTASVPASCQSGRSSFLMMLGGIVLCPKSQLNLISFTFHTDCTPPQAEWNLSY